MSIYDHDHIWECENCGPVKARQYFNGPVLTWICSICGEEIMEKDVS